MIAHSTMNSVSDKHLEVFLAQMTWPRIKALHALSHSDVSVTQIDKRVRDWLTNSCLATETAHLISINERGRIVWNAHRARTRS